MQILLQAQTSRPLKASLPVCLPACLSVCLSVCLSAALLYHTFMATRMWTQRVYEPHWIYISMLSFSQALLSKATDSAMNGDEYLQVCIRAPFKVWRKMFTSLTRRVYFCGKVWRITYSCGLDPVLRDDQISICISLIYDCIAINVIG